MNPLFLDAASNDVRYGISKENKTLRLLLDPGNLSGSVDGDVFYQLEKKIGSYFPAVGAILVGFGDFTVRQVVNIIQDEEEIPVEAVVEGDYYVIKRPEVGKELL